MRNQPAVALAAMIREKLPTICLSLIVIAIPFFNTMSSIIAQALCQSKRLEFEVGLNSLQESRQQNRRQRLNWMEALTDWQIAVRRAEMFI